MSCHTNLLPRYGSQEHVSAKPSTKLKSTATVSYLCKPAVLFFLLGLLFSKLPCLSFCLLAGAVMSIHVTFDFLGLHGQTAQTLPVGCSLGDNPPFKVGFDGSPVSDLFLFQALQAQRSYSLILHIFCGNTAGSSLQDGTLSWKSGKS